MAYGFNEDKSKVDIKTLVLDTFYPVGSIYMSVNSTNPSSTFGGTWVRWGSGKVPVGVDTDDSSFNTVEKTGGEKTHKLSSYELPAHKHKTTDQSGESDPYVSRITSLGTAGSGQEVAVLSAYDYSYLHVLSTGSTGSGSAHNNLQPYITCYMWKRTA